MFDRIKAIVSLKPRLAVFKRTHTVLFTSMWLHGTYTVEVQSGDDLQEAISARVIELVCGEPDYATIRAIKLTRHQVEQVW